MLHLIASIAASSLFALASVLPAHAGTSLGDAPTIGLVEAWSLVGTGAVAVAWRLFSRQA
jgi:hypothetical protein